MLYYDQHSHQNYQYRFLTLGLFIGGILSLHLNAQSTPLNVITAIIPTSITLTLILSAIIHSIWQAFFPSKAEKVFRLLQTWALGVSIKVAADKTEELEGKTQANFNVFLIFYSQLAKNSKERKLAELVAYLKIIQEAILHRLLSAYADCKSFFSCDSFAPDTLYALLHPET